MPDTLVAPAAPAAIAPAAPSKPAVAPAKPSTPAPAKAAAPAPAHELSDEGNEYDKAFEAHEQKRPDAVKAQDPVKETPKPGAPAAKAPDDDKLLKSNPQLRARLDVVTAEASEARAKVADYEARIKDAEKHGESVKVLTAQLEAKEKVLGEMQGQIRMLKQEVSPEFVEKWDKPFNQAAEIAKRSIERLTITDPKTGEARRATWNDFIPFYRNAIVDGGVIDFEGLKERFGDGATIATTFINDLAYKNDLREKALGEEKAGWETKQKEDAAKEITTRTQQEAAAKKFQADEAKFSKEFVEKNPELYDDIPGDDEGNKLRLESQQELANTPKTPDEAIAYRTKLYHKAGNFDREHYLRTKAETALAEANATIEAMKASGPGKTRRDGATATAAGGETFEEEMRRVGQRG